MQVLLIFIPFIMSEVKCVEAFLYQCKFKFKGLTSLYTLIQHVHIFLSVKGGVQAQETISRWNGIRRNMICHLEKQKKTVRVTGSQRTTSYLQGKPAYKPLQPSVVKQLRQSWKKLVNNVVMYPRYGECCCKIGPSYSIQRELGLPRGFEKIEAGS